MKFKIILALTIISLSSVGADEASDSIELAKEILKALYQLQSLVDRLQSRKKKIT